MYEQDYLMRLLMRFFKAIVRSRELKEESAQDAADLLEDEVGVATELDGAALLSLAPDSIAQVLRVTGTDPNVIEFVCRSLLLESVYLSDAGRPDLSALRASQARAIALEYGFDLPEDPADFDAITEGLEKAALAGGFGQEIDPFAGLLDE